MKRRSIFAGIAALFAQRAGAQVPTGAGCSTCGTKAPEITPETAARVCMTKFSCGIVEPDQCPVCGTMAEPYVREKGAQYLHDLKTWTIRREEAPSGPMERTTRCHRCSAAFWQTAKE